MNTKFILILLSIFVCFSLQQKFYFDNRVATSVPRGTIIIRTNSYIPDIKRFRIPQVTPQETKIQTIKRIIDDQVPEPYKSIVDDIFKCIHQIEPFAKDVEIIIRAIKEKKYDVLIDTIYQAIQDGHSSFNQCISAFPKAEEYIKSLIKIDLNDLVKCILESKVVAKDILEIVNIIKNKDFYNLVPKIAKLLIDGDNVVKSCIDIFKKVKDTREQKREKNFCAKYCYNPDMKISMNRAFECIKKCLV